MTDRPGPVWELKPLRIAELREPYTVSADGLTIGRDDSNSVVLPAGSYPGVSSAHARIVVDGDRLFLEDLGSKNGTFHAGERVERVELHNGSLIELGSGGPRFLLVRSTGLDETVTIETPKARGERSIGRDTMMLVREKLGLSETENVEAKLHEQEKKATRRLVALAAGVIVLIGATVWVLNKISDSAVAEMKTETDRIARALEKQLQNTASRFESEHAKWTQWRKAYENDRTSWNDNKTSLERERKLLLASIKRLEAADATASGELKGLREKLDETDRRLVRYDPVELETSKLKGVARVESSVVMIEASLTYVEKKTNRELYVQFDDQTGKIVPNFSGEGMPLEKSGTGSGFCFTNDGWILTNAHVVFKKGEKVLDLGSDIELTPRLELQVVWSGTSKRYPAKLDSWISGEGEDLALLKVAPFPGMRYLTTLELEQPLPARHSDVFLLGFPYGQRVLQEGEKVIASTFRGIVSRFVDKYIQVDAAVHPGASGGPLINAQGKIVGVVMARHRVSRNASTADIGYIIPISQAKKLWPRPKKSK